MAKHYKPTNKLIIILLIFKIFFIILLIISVRYIIKWFIDSKQNETIKNKISEAIIENSLIDEENKNEQIIDETSENKDYEIDFNKLKEINQQVVAWLKVKGTNIEYPVVQANDNSYYLKNNLDKKYNIGGWIFADYKNKFDGTDKNIVIYGHNRKNGTMFSSLKNILKKEWYNNPENLKIQFITENEEASYEVFSVYQIEKEDYYIQTNFNTDEQYSTFVKTLKNRSIKDFGIDVTIEDQILTLSTCANDNNYRVVLHARKIITPDN